MLYFLLISLVAALALKKPQLSDSQLAYLGDDPAVTHLVTFQIASGTAGSEGPKLVGSLELALFGELLPITTDNFVKLANNSLSYGYKNVLFHRIIENFMIQGGDWENGDGTGGRSAFATSKFNDENFIVHHDKLGRLSMANAGPNTNGAQFFITTNSDCSWLDGKHVVFGQLVGGFDTLAKLNAVKTNPQSRPIEDVFAAEVQTTRIRDPRNVHLDYALDSAAAPAVGWTYFLFAFCIILVLGSLYYVKMDYRRQYITDIKDSNYF